MSNRTVKINDVKYVEEPGHEDDLHLCDDCDLVGHPDITEECKFICAQSENACVESGFVYRKVD